MDVENDSLSPKKIGDGNHWLQCSQRIEISVVFDIATPVRRFLRANAELNGARRASDLSAGLGGADIGDSK